MIKEKQKIASGSYIDSSGKLGERDDERIQKIVDNIVYAAFEHHKREIERSLTELLRLRQDINEGEVYVEDVLEVGSSAALEKQRLREQTESPYKLPEPPRGVFLTKRA